LKQLARVRRRAGKVRDLDIQMRTLASVKLEAAVREKTRVVRVLKKSHAKRRRQLVLELAEETASGLEKRLRRLAARVAGRPSHPTSDVEERDEREVLGAALDQFSGLVHAYGRLTEDNLHDFRTDTKRLRYLAESAGKGLEARSAVHQFKRIQDAIGSWHDWLTLTRTATKVLDAPAKSPLLTALRIRTRARFLRALRITADAKQDLAELRLPAETRKPPRRVTTNERSQVGRTGASSVAALRPAIGSPLSPLAVFHVDGDVWRR
jgi:CHAD domain-containing protein